MTQAASRCGAPKNRLVIKGDMHMASKNKKGKIIVSTLKNVYPPPEEKAEAKPAETAEEAAPPEAPPTPESATEVEGKPKTKKAKAEKPKKTSALDAAAKVLSEAGKPMNTKEMIDAMTAKGLWTSPNGLTPHATLYSALFCEINTKGEKARFKKADKGQFALRLARDHSPFRPPDATRRLFSLVVSPANREPGTRYGATLALGCTHRDRAALPHLYRNRFPTSPSASTATWR